MRINSDINALLADLKRFPWRTTAATLKERFSEDRLGLSASSLTFTTMIAIVPFFALVLSVFTAFPIFGKFQVALQQWLIDSLVPENIAKQVVVYLTKFAIKASRVGWLGFVFLGISALSLVITIDKTLNNIWRAPRLRPIGQRVLVYWATLTLGPILLGGSLSLSSYAVSASKGFVDALPGGVTVSLDILQWFLVVCGMASLYKYVPNMVVRWRHAFIGGMFVAIALEIAKKLLAIYLGSVPTYSAVYGTFATVPILLIWIYIAWVIVLFGAVIAAYLPSMLAGVARRGGSEGWNFQLALEVLSKLHQQKEQKPIGATLEQLAISSQVDVLQLQGPVKILEDMEWIGQLVKDESELDHRYILIIDPAKTLFLPLAQALLLKPDAQNKRFYEVASKPGLTLAEVLHV